MTEIQKIKDRFGIIGNSHLLSRCIDIANQVASTDLSVLITGESGTGKEIFPQIIHHNSSRKHGPYIAVNCGAIPEGTIDSELFGHEKGSFTGATDSRKGYFEVANKGTIFLDEVAELPLSTQVRLLRVLETGEFIRVGSSQVQKTNVRVVAATNINVMELIKNKRFREDLFYRLNTVPIQIPALRERKEDIYLLFRKFAYDFAEKYRMPPILIDNDAVDSLQNYPWPGNIRQLKNVTEQISVIEKERNISTSTLSQYLPYYQTTVMTPAKLKSDDGSDFSTEREILYKILFEMRKELNDLKTIVYEMIKPGGETPSQSTSIFSKLYRNEPEGEFSTSLVIRPTENLQFDEIQKNNVVESLSLEQKEIELIRKALEKYQGKRKLAADELGISERTLYRKIKEYDLE